MILVLQKRIQQVLFLSGISLLFSFGCGSNDHEGVVDRSTGLLWQKCTAGLSGENCTEGRPTRYSFKDAQTYCDSLGWGNHKWRLPLIGEILELRRCYQGWRRNNLIGKDTCRSNLPKGERAGCKRIVARCDGKSNAPSIDAAIFPMTPMSGFWSDSKSPQSKSRVWGISFDKGYIQMTNPDNKIYVRCVTDPSGNR